MARHTYTRDQVELVRSGDVIVAIDGRELPLQLPVGAPPRRLSSGNWAVRLVNESGVTEWVFYPDTQMAENFTIEREEP